MNQANSKTRNAGYIVRLWIMLPLALILFTLAGCGTATEESPDRDEIRLSGIDWDQTVVETDDIRDKTPIMIQDITNETEKKYMSFVAYMDKHATKPRFVFDSADRLSERDKFEFARRFQSFLTEQNPDTENQLPSWNEEDNAVSRISASAVTQLVKIYLDADFDPEAALGVSRGSFAGDDLMLGYDREGGEYLLWEAYDANTHNGDEYGHYALLDFTEIRAHVYTVQAGFYGVNFWEEEESQYTLQYTYDMLIEEDAADSERFIVRSSILTSFDSGGNAMTLGTPWNYQTPGWTEDPPRVLIHMDNRVTKPGDTMSEEEVLDQFLRLLPAGFEVSMWYLDKGAQALTPGSGAPMTIDGREGWFSIARYSSIDEMKTATQTVFSEGFCIEQLYPDAFEDSENSKYKEFNLRIYVNQNTGGVKDYLSFNGYNAAVISREPGVLTISMSYSHQSDESSETFPFLFTMIDQGGRWVFDSWPELV